MATHADVCTRWVDIHTTTPDATPLKSDNLYPIGATLYSYGVHFELARALKDTAGGTRLFLLNGDRYSVSTSRHQTRSRAAVDRSGAPRVIIPFPALEAAGVDIGTVALVDATADRIETFEHVAWTQPEGSVWRTEPVCAYVDLSAEEVQAKLDERDERARTQWGYEQKWAREEPEGYWAKHPRPEPQPHTADDLPSYERREWRTVGEERVLYRNARTNRDRIHVTPQPDGRTRFSWTTAKHWLGESLVTATVHWSGFTTCKPCGGSGRRSDLLDLPWEQGRCLACNGARGEHWSRSRRAMFLSGFDHQEPRPLYFFCELPPGCQAGTVAEAYKALKPDPVVLAEAMGRGVHRQGDIFAVALSERVGKRDLRKAGATFEPSGLLLGTNHAATEVARMPDGSTLARGTLRHVPSERQPDHRRVRLGKTWHVVAKNTVPVAS